MATRLRSKNCHIQMKGGWVCHNHGIRSMSESRVKIMFNWIASQILGWQLTLATAIEENIFFAQSFEVIEMPASNRAESSDQEFHFTNQNLVRNPKRLELPQLSL